MPKKKAWYSFSVQEIFSQLKTTKSGLDADEAKKRIEKSGPNKLVEEKPLGELKLFFSQFKSVLIYILLAAAVISGILMEWVDLGIILAAVLVNVILGYVQESKAQKSLLELKKFLFHFLITNLLRYILIYITPHYQRHIYIYQKLN